MKLTSLGHSCFLLEMLSESGDVVRILGDPWLSDYAYGDLMGRFPRVRIDYEALPPIHGIYLSHSHSDHLDPYSLVELFQNLDPAPTLLLPQSLDYLVPFFRETFEQEITVIEENESVDFMGLTITTLFNLELSPTNEDDVMILVVENGTEIFFSECDAVLPLYDPIARDQISTILGGSGEGIETTVFLTTKNELGSLMASFHASGNEERATLVATAEDQTLKEIESIYRPTIEDLDPTVEPQSDLWLNENLVRLVGGQGLCFPQTVDPEWNRVLFPIRLADRVHMEREVASDLDCAHQIHSFEPGIVHVLEDGTLDERYPAEFIRLLDDESDRTFDPELELFDPFPSAPLREDERDYDEQQKLIIDLLNQRFLPYLIGRRNPPIEHLLAANSGLYVVRIRYGTRDDHENRDYAISFRRLSFALDPSFEDPDEFYWANDIEDFASGWADDFSTFCRHPLGGEDQRFWDSLGMPYLNNDFCEKKIRNHFERALRGETIESYVLEFYEIETEEEDDEVDLNLPDDLEI